MYIRYKWLFLFGILLILSGAALFAYAEFKKPDYIALAEEHLASSNHTEHLDKPKVKATKKKAKKNKSEQPNLNDSIEPKTTKEVPKIIEPKPEKKTVSKTKVVPSTKPASQVSSENFYIISGCFSSEENANTHVKNLKTEGFTNAFVVGKVNDLYNVSFGTYHSREEAEKNLNEIREKFQSSAWILYI